MWGGGGVRVMSLTEMYCLVNPAPGMELLLPEDLVNVYKMLKLPVRLWVFDNDILVNELLPTKEEEMVGLTLDPVSESGSLTWKEIAHVLPPG